MAVVTAPIHHFSDHLKRRYRFKVWKLPVDAGFTCPNRDGNRAWGGCTYCDNRSFSPPARNRSVALREQLERGLARHRADGIDHTIVFFQAYTNTYAPLGELRECYDLALSFPGVVGLSIATRPDCLADPVLDLLEEYGRRTDLWLELGIETSHDETLTRINRAHTWAETVDAVARARGRGFEIIGHLIYGLPGETGEMMMETTDRVACLGLDAVKLHHFYVARSTPLEEAFRRGEIVPMSFEEWTTLAADVVERLPASMYIERVAGELRNDWLVAPRWGQSPGAVWGAVEKELTRRGTRQGSKRGEADGHLREVRADALR